MKQLTILSTVFLSVLMAFNTTAADRYNKNKSNMTILAAWAGVNMIQGSISATNATGYGNSLLLQSAFLLVFDLVQYGNHRRNGKILEGQLLKLQIHASGNGIGLRLPL